jgi:hypothetical protein
MASSMHMTKAGTRPAAFKVVSFQSIFLRHPFCTLRVARQADRADALQLYCLWLAYKQAGRRSTVAVRCQAAVEPKRILMMGELEACSL